MSAWNVVTHLGEANVPSLVDQDLGQIESAKFQCYYVSNSSRLVSVRVRIGLRVGVSDSDRDSVKHRIVSKQCTIELTHIETMPRA